MPVSAGKFAGGANEGAGFGIPNFEAIAVIRLFVSGLVGRADSAAGFQNRDAGKMGIGYKSAAKNVLRGCFNMHSFQVNTESTGSFIVRSSHQILSCLVRSMISTWLKK